MKYLITLFISLSLSFNTIACDWSTIKKQGNSFVYSAECHDQVGKLADSEKERKKQVEKLEQSIELKDLALTTAEKRVELWKKTTYEVEDRALRYKKFANLTKYGWFAMGVISVFASAYAFDKVRK